jgi:hypothetical protein
MVFSKSRSGTFQDSRKKPDGPAGLPTPLFLLINRFKGSMRFCFLRKIFHETLIITLINIAIKRLLTSGYPAGYLMVDARAGKKMGEMT